MRRSSFKLALVYFQTREYAKAKTPPEVTNFKSFLEMMIRFPGKPNRVEWTTKEKTAIVPYAEEVMLPTIPVSVNGKPLKFILDTGGEEVEEFLGRAERVAAGEVALGNVPFTLAEWKSRGIQSDGVLSTQALKEFLFTIDYAGKKMIFLSHQFLKNFGSWTIGFDSMKFIFAR